MGDDQQKCGFLFESMWCGDERGRQGQMGDDQQNCGFLLKVCGVVMKGVDRGRWVTISRNAVSF